MQLTMVYQLSLIVHLTSLYRMPLLRVHLQTYGLPLDPILVILLLEHTPLHVQQLIHQETKALQVLQLLFGSLLLKIQLHTLVQLTLQLQLQIFLKLLLQTLAITFTPRTNLLELYAEP